MPKSRGRKPARRPARHPWRRRLGPAAQDAWARLAGLLEYGDSADPVQVTALLPLFLDAVAADHRLPPERCLDDCVVVAHAYAQLSITAEVRAAELAITTATGQSSTHGSLNPRWQDGLIHGHAVVWLPGLAHLADVTAGQDPRSQRQATGRSSPPAPCSPAATPPGTERGLSGGQAASRFPASRQARLIPHPRAAALTEAVRNLPDHRTPSGDHRFMLPCPEGHPVAARLDEIPLPGGTPPAADAH